MNGRVGIAITVWILDRARTTAYHILDTAGTVFVIRACEVRTIARHAMFVGIVIFEGT